MKLKKKQQQVKNKEKNIASSIALVFVHLT